MQTVFLGDNLHEMSNIIFWKNKNLINLLSSESAHNIVIVMGI